MSEHARVLFVSNGHGEIAIAARLARDLPQTIDADHLALVGVSHAAGRMNEAGPRRALPSGGLVAMGNVRNIARDVRAGLVAHTIAQLRFLRSVRNQYDVAVAVGDVFALIMAFQAKARRTVYVGTAKSAYVAPYGAFERNMVGRADAVFVRDEATAEQLRAHGIPAHGANVIVDLHAVEHAAALAPYDPLLAVFPGSREAAYGDAVRLCRIVRLVARGRPQCGALLSIAPGLDAAQMGRALAADGWQIANTAEPGVSFIASWSGREIVRAFSGPLETALAHAAIVLGQAGTANEAAAAAGIPVVAYEETPRTHWYRRRQIALLGDALLVVRGDAASAAAQVDALLADAQRRAAMRAAGRSRMGPPGASARIDAEVVRLCG